MKGVTMSRAKLHTWAMSGDVDADEGCGSASTMPAKMFAFLRAWSTWTQTAPPYSSCSFFCMSMEREPAK